MESKRSAPDFPGRSAHIGMEGEAGQHGEEANLKVFKVEQIPMGEAVHYHGSCRVLPFWGSSFLLSRRPFSFGANFSFHLGRTSARSAGRRGSAPFAPSGLRILAQSELVGQPGSQFPYSCGTLIARWVESLSGLRIVLLRLGDAQRAIGSCQTLPPRHPTSHPYRSRYPSMSTNALTSPAYHLL